MNRNKEKQENHQVVCKFPKDSPSTAFNMRVKESFP